VVVVAVWVSWGASSSVYSHHWVLPWLHLTHCVISATVGTEPCTCWSVYQHSLYFFIVLKHGSLCLSVCLSVNLYTMVEHGVNVCLCLYVCVSVCLCVTSLWKMSVWNLSVKSVSYLCLSVCMSVCVCLCVTELSEVLRNMVLNDCLSVCLYVCLCVFLYVCLSVCIRAIRSAVEHGTTP